MKNGFGFLFACAAALTVWGGDASLDVLAARYADVSAERAVTNDIATWCAALRADGSWPDIDYASRIRATWPAGSHLTRLVKLAAAGRRTGDRGIWSAAHAALGFWLAKRLDNPNWWWNVIGIPLCLGDAALMMDGVLTEAERRGVVEIMSVAEPDHAKTGQNFAWMAENRLRRGLLARDGKTVRTAIADLLGGVRLGQAEGIQSDWCFHQHGRQPQFGNYGLSFLCDQARLSTVLAGTAFAYPADKLELVRRLAAEGYAWIVWKGMMDVSAMGRQLDRGYQRGKAEAVARAFADLERSGWRRPPEPTGFRFFDRSAYAVWRTADWMATVRASTKDVIGTETWINEDNVKGMCMADGALLTYVTGREYENALPLWDDWRMVPGVTGYLGKPVDRGDARNRRDDIVARGGADGGTFSFTFEREGLVAHKKWSFDRGGILCEGSGISATDGGYEVATCVEHAMAAANAGVVYSRPDESCFRNGSVVYTVHAPREAIRFEIAERTGDYRTFMQAHASAPVKGRVFSLRILHGRSPKNASYRYRIDVETVRADCREGVDEWFVSRTVPRTAAAKLLVPHSVGRVISPDWRAKGPLGEVFRCDPGWGMTYRMVALLNETGESYAIVQKGAREHASFLRVRRGALDGEAILDSGYVPDADDLKRGSPALPFETRVLPFRGGWFAAAELYRRVVADEPWLREAKARDFGRMRDISFWFWNRLDSETVIPPVERFAREAGVPVALDWYWWHRISYDTGYPNYWPPREPPARFAAAVKRLNAEGIFAQTYLNGMLWDEDDPSWRDGGVQGARRNRDGSFSATAWNRFTNHRLAEMCGEAPAFQERMRGLVKRMRALGFDGQYLDCIGNGGYGACWAPEHAHAAGGGTHEVRDYRKFVGTVMAENPGMALCTEDVNESYLDLFTSFIVTSPSYERFSGAGDVAFEQVPVFTAVYHGAGVFFGNFATPGGIPAWDPQWPAAERWTDERDWPKMFPDQFPVELARGVVWGLQPTAHNFRREDCDNPSCADMLRFMVETAKFHHANRDLLFDGEMRDPGTLVCARRKVAFLNRGTYTKKGEYAVATHELPTVFHSVWRRGGRTSAVLVNWSRQPQAYRLETPELAAAGTLPPLSWRRAEAVVTCYAGCNVGSPDRQAIHVLACDTGTGAAKIVQSVKGCEGTTYFQLDRDGKYLYSVAGRLAEAGAKSAVVRFPVLGDGRLGPVEKVADLPCETPCHVALTADGSRVAFAAYASATAGTVGTDGRGLRVFSFPDDAMGPNRRRQPKAYAHQAFNLPDGRLGVCDLGCDRIWFFDPQTMSRDASREIRTEPGDGPRHAVVSRDGRFLFVLNELGSAVASYGLSSLARLGRWSTLPADFNRWASDGETLATKAAAIRMTEDGRILMASNRGYDSIAFFAVGDDGRLTLRNIAKLTGRFPRDFALMPGERFMVVGHKMSNEIQVYRFDRAACTLEPVGAPIAAWRPLCFVFGTEGGVACR